MMTGWRAGICSTTMEATSTDNRIGQKAGGVARSGHASAKDGAAQGTRGRAELFRLASARAGHCCGLEDGCSRLTCVPACAWPCLDNSLCPRKYTIQEIQAQRDLQQAFVAVLNQPDVPQTHRAFTRVSRLLGHLGGDMPVSVKGKGKGPKGKGEGIDVGMQQPPALNDHPPALLVPRSRQ